MSFSYVDRRMEGATATFSNNSQSISLSSSSLSCRSSFVVTPGNDACPFAESVEVTKNQSLFSKPSKLV